ncbi:myosin-VIIa-like [Saccoglossus kowalevskii]|uniref:Myosin-VIIa-like n=1 Tax=Saccoglossus kowalevskii TaxID=10224 RepID=A0ABM0MD65_SACKO|nr:PREDICTED: myosin-VIIa-like [Saccoglossus kowalevskii]
MAATVNEDIMAATIEKNVATMDELGIDSDEEHSQDANWNSGKKMDQWEDIDLTQKEVSMDRKPFQLGELHTLKDFARKQFRPLGKKGKLWKQQDEENLWSFSQENLKEPLLKKSLINQDLAKLAVTSFTMILKYMNEVRKTKACTDVTDQIFRPAIVYEPLRDETYCQIIKQLTNNQDRAYEERCWELMWLVTGLFVCSQGLLPEVIKFLQSRHKIDAASQSYRRLQMTLQNGNRKQPPHIYEIEAVQNKRDEILHEVLFPNGHIEFFTVSSCTKVIDMHQNIVGKLKLVCKEGLSLFITFSDKVLSCPDNEFFFDFIRTAMDWNRAMNPKDAGKFGSYQIYFMRKLWLNVVPGKDVNADYIFHYHQELPKLLKGYHKCTKKEASDLAALQYRVRYGDNKAAFQSLHNNVNEYIPQDIIAQQNAECWRKDIESAYDGQKTMTRVQAKVAFMKIIYKWPTYGSVFFEVKQTSQSQLPEVLLVAINKRGVILYNIKTKAMLSSYPFSRISTWSSGHNFFHITFGNLVKGMKMSCSTPLGYRMDDLITSYISHQMKKDGRAWPHRR